MTAFVKGPIEPATRLWQDCRTKGLPGERGTVLSAANQRDRDRELNISEELARYPLTGRFLMGRLRHAMSDHEKAVVESLIEEVEEHDHLHEILGRGNTCNRSTMLIEGFVLRTIYEHDDRHVVAIQVPGDFVDLHCFALKRLDHNVITVGPAKVGFVPHERLREVMREEPHLTRLLWFSTLLDAAIHRQWILKLEQLKAARRVAHLFAEIWTRLDMVGLAQEGGFDTPLTQADLAGMCGTTAIHMNRALGELRQAGIADFQRGVVSIASRAELERFGDFNRDYLYSEGELFHAESPDFM